MICLLDRSVLSALCAVDGFAEHSPVRSLRWRASEAARTRGLAQSFRTDRGTAVGVRQLRLAPTKRHCERWSVELASDPIRPGDALIIYLGESGEKSLILSDAEQQPENCSSKRLRRFQGPRCLRHRIQSPRPGYMRNYRPRAGDRSWDQSGTLANGFPAPCLRHVRRWDRPLLRHLRTLLGGFQITWSGIPILGLF